MELETALERMNNLIEDNAREHAAILEQVKKTNGSVASIQKWRYMITGALFIMNLFFVPIILSIVIKYIAGRV